MINELCKLNTVNPPKWLPSNTVYECIMGSQAYGVSNNESDFDIRGICVPPKRIVFPHEQGCIIGFSTNIEKFDQWQLHGIQTNEKEYDVEIGSIVKFFRLCMDCNPEKIDTLFVPQNCILSITSVGQMIRDNRNIFLHKGAYHRMRGYAYSQLHKARGKNPQEGSKRSKLRKQHGVDTKFLYHVVRLLDEAEQILSTGTLDLQRAKEHMKAVRRGEVSLEEVIEHFNNKEKTLEQLYANSSIPYRPDEEKIRDLLLACLEQHYGSIEKCIVVEDRNKLALREIEKIVQKYL